MIEVIDNLYVGDQEDYESGEWGDDWAIVQACKEPYHRQALGYTGRGAPKDHSEYLIARRYNRMILNLVDADRAEFIPSQIILEAILFINMQMLAGKKVLVHCNQGVSRSAGIALLYLNAKGMFKGFTFRKSEDIFKGMYPHCRLGKGMSDYLQLNWGFYDSILGGGE